MFLGDGLERYRSGFKSVPARIVRKGSRLSLCLVLTGGERCSESDSPKSLRDFIGDSGGQLLAAVRVATAVVLILICRWSSGVKSFSALVLILSCNPLNFGRAYGPHPAKLWAPPRRTLARTRAILAMTRL